MPIKYKYDPKLNVVYSFPYGKVSDLDISDYFNELINNDEINTGFIEVAYFKNIEDFLFSSDKASNILEKYMELRKAKNLNTTLLVGESDLHFGFARMFEIFHGMVNPEGTFFVVRSEEEADDIIKKLMKKR